MNSNADSGAAGLAPCIAPEGELARALKPRHVAMIALGGIIGAGLFVGSSAGIAAVGPGILVSYFLAGAMILLVMRMLGEMAVANPGLGGFTEYARLGLGDWAGYVTGWLYWFFWVVVVAVEAIAAAGVLEPMTGLPVWQTGLGLLIAMTITNLWSARTYGEFEFWFASIKVGAILAFVLTAAAYLFGSPPAAGTFANLTGHGGFAPFGIPAILAGVTTVIFSLVGAEAATIAAAESEEPGRIVARMTTQLVVRVTLFYLLSLFLIVCIVPWRDIVPGQSPFVAALNVIGIPGASTLMSFLVLTAVLSCLNSGIYVTSRTLFVLAARGDAPAQLVALNARRVPARAILLGMVFGYLGVIASVISPQVVFAFLINASGAVMLFIYIIIAVAQIRTRRRLEQTDPARLQVKMWLFPWLSYAVIAGIAGVLIAMALTASLASQLYMSLLALGVVLTGYFIRARVRPAR
ncbi:MAG: amino acid permease [Rhodospirillaceae bacterium]